jgi:predicted phosphodiesterase
VLALVSLHNAASSAAERQPIRRISIMRIAVIADIHSNAPALEAVLEDLSGRSVDRIVHLGDAFNGPVDPAAVAMLLRSWPMVHVRGNGERMVLSDDPQEQARSALYARERLSSDDLAWIRGWPLVVSEPAFIACHASPTSDTDYLLEELVIGGVRLRKREDILLQLGSIQAPIVLCAHTHVPRFVRVRDGLGVLNPGSVGLPAYAHQLPISHVMEVGSPEARYAIAEIHGTKVIASHFCIPYDYAKAALRAERAGFSEWASILRIGYGG